MGSPSPSSWSPARQDRSRRTAERIVAAALELLDSKGFEDMSVAEIAARAGVSVGGFYARFPGKDALLDFLNVDVFDRLVTACRERLAPDAVAGRGAREVIARYVDLAVGCFREHRVVLRQVALRSRTSVDPAFRERVREANRALHGVFRARLHERVDEMAHPDPATGVDVALTAVSAVMREYVLFSDLRPHFDPLEDRRLSRELTDLFCAYLGIP